MKVEILHEKTVKRIVRDIFKKEVEPVLKHINILREKVLKLEEEIITKTHTNGGSSGVRG